MTTPKMTEEEELVRCFAEFMMSSEEGVWSSGKSSFAAAVIRNKKDKRFRLLVDFDYDNSDEPSLNIYTRSLSVIGDHEF